MRNIALLSLYIFLTACTTSTTLESREPTERAPQPARHPTVLASLQQSAPLYLWNETHQRYEIHLVDLNSGQDVPSHTPFVVSENTQFTGTSILSSDGQKLAVVATKGEYCFPSGGGTACVGRADTLHLIDVPVWREVTAPLPGDGWVGPISFRPDITQVALSFNDLQSSKVMIFDTRTGELTVQHEITFRPSLMEYTPDGGTLVVYGQQQNLNRGVARLAPPSLVLISATTLKVQWEAQLSNILSGSWCLENCDQSHEKQTHAQWTPAVILSSDGTQLYIAHADKEQLTVVDFDTRTSHTREVQEPRSWFEEFLAFTADVAKAKGNFIGGFKEGVLSPDGTRLYLLSQEIGTSADTTSELRQSEQSSRVEIIEIATGQRLAQVDSDATWMKVTPDGDHLMLGNWVKEQIDILETQSLRSITQLSNWETAAAYPANNESLLLVSMPGQTHTELAVLNAKSFEVIHSWSVNTSYARWIITP